MPLGLDKKNWIMQLVCIKLTVCNLFRWLVLSIDIQSNQSAISYYKNTKKIIISIGSTHSFPLWNISNTLIESYEGQISTWITIGDTSWYEWTGFDHYRIRSIYWWLFIYYLNETRREIHFIQNQSMCAAVSPTGVMKTIEYHWMKIFFRTTNIRREKESHRFFLRSTRISSFIRSGIR